MREVPFDDIMKRHTECRHATEDGDTHKTALEAVRLTNGWSPRATLTKRNADTQQRMARVELACSYEPSSQIDEWMVAALPFDDIMKTRLSGSEQEKSRLRIRR